jgi:xanthine dehydrogenase accessory factor
VRSADREVLETAMAWLAAGQVVYLVTVARTWGSSPRPPGSLLAVRADSGQFVGSVSGGCVEDDLCARLAAHGTKMSLPHLETYGLTADQTAHFGLPCGGRLELLVERLTTVEMLRPLLRAIDNRARLARRVCFATGEASLHPASDQEEFRFDGANLIKVFGPAWRLVLIGAGQLSRFVAEIAQALEYSVIVCEPRDDLAAAWEVPGTLLDSRSPDVAVKQLACDDRTAVLALSHDPRLDDLALMEALSSKAFYVGALGSRVNSARRRARLHQVDVPDKALARLHAPIGLSIGSRTPAEIAIAILAEITAVRHGVTLITGSVLPTTALDSDTVLAERPTCSESPASC